MTAAIASGSMVAGATQPATYDKAVRLSRRPLDSSGGVREIVRAGSLAANSHNTQPWRFVIDEMTIRIRPDLRRRCPAVDPDDHHLYASLGCAVENMVQAASMLGFRAEVKFETGSQAGVAIALQAGQRSSNELAQAITQRQCSRTEYDGRAVATEDLSKIAAAGTVDDVDCLLVTDRPRMDVIRDFVIQGNTAQMRDAAFMSELVAWIRFNDAMAIEHMDGLSARSSGNPSLPAWLSRRLLPFVMTEKGENDKYARQIGSSAGIAAFIAASNDKVGWIAAGRAYQRFALQATALGIRQAFINQPVEVLALRPQIASYLGIGQRRPNLIVQFGHGPAMPHALRRPIEMMIDPS